MNKVRLTKHEIEIQIVCLFFDGIDFMFYQARRPGQQNICLLNEQKQMTH